MAGPEVPVEGIWVMVYKSNHEMTAQASQLLLWSRDSPPQETCMPEHRCCPSHTLLSLVWLSLAGPCIFLFFFLLVFRFKEGRDSSSSLFLASQSSSCWSRGSPFCLAVRRCSWHSGSALCTFPTWCLHSKSRIFLPPSWVRSKLSFKVQINFSLIRILSL